MRAAFCVAVAPAVVVTTLLLLVEDSLWPAVLTYHALCLGIPLAGRCSFREAGLVLSDWRRWLLPTTALSVLLLAAGAAAPRMIDVETFLPHGWEPLLPLTEPWSMFVAYSLCINPFLEEYFWRGFLLPKTGVLGGAALFWIMHMSAASVLLAAFDAVWITLPAFVAAVVWGFMRQRFQTLWPCVITHAAADAAILAAVSALRT